MNKMEMTFLNYFPQNLTYNLIIGYNKTVTTRDIKKGSCHNDYKYHCRAIYQLPQ